MAKNFKSTRQRKKVMSKLKGTGKIRVTRKIKVKGRKTPKKITYMVSKSKLRR